MDQIDRLTRLIGDVLGADLIGTYLHGSSVLGGLRPASDVDVLAVARRSLDDPRRGALVDGLLRISGAGSGARPVELVVVVQAQVRPWRYPPTVDLLYGDWLRDEIDANGPPRPHPSPDLAVLATTVLARGRALAGPPPAAVLDPVPSADVVRACRAGIPGLLDDLPHDTRNVVLTLARIWTTLATGEIRSKDTAADWALARLPPEHRPVLEHARRMYLERHYADETWSAELAAGVRPHVDAVLAEIRAL